MISSAEFLENKMPATQANRLQVWQNKCINQKGLTVC